RLFQARWIRGVADFVAEADWTLLNLSASHTLKIAYSHKLELRHPRNDSGDLPQPKNRFFTDSCSLDEIYFAPRQVVSMRGGSPRFVGDRSVSSLPVRRRTTPSSGAQLGVDISEKRSSHSRQSDK